MPINMYVALQDDDKLVRFSVEPETGKLDREQEYTLSGAPSSLAISPNGRTLYVGHRTSGQISSHRIGLLDRDADGERESKPGNSSYISSNGP